jgi:para-nitrobenzyl esterase
LAGTWEDGALAFYDIPYGEHAGRFQPAASPGKWEGIRDASKPGPVFPQVRNKLGSVMGALREEANQHEDAFRLNIWTPNLEARLPVFFFIHGGGFATGGGGLPWYNGSVLAASGRAVVVTVNYRLGALGHLYLPGISEGNLAFRDLAAAFQWVRENISFFGGDPERITIAGQSAGAWYAMAMMANKEIAMQAQGFCLFSYPGIQPASPDTALELSKVLCEQLNAGPGGEHLLTLKTDRLLAAQNLAVKELKAAKQTDVMFGPVADGVWIADDIVREALRHAGSRRTKLFIGTTREESAFFFHARQMDNYDDYLAFIRQTSKVMFIDPAHRVAAQMSDAGIDTYVYQFHYPSKNPRFLACHCFDLPFVFGNFDRWESAPMLAGADLEEARSISGKLRECLLRFLERGTPDAGDLVNWPRYDSKNRKMMFVDIKWEVGAYPD